MSKDKLTTQELIDLLAQKAGVSKKTAEEFLKAFFLTIEDSLLANDFVKIRNFGTFKKQWNEARKSINVRTGEEIQIEGFNKVVFVPESKLKELVNEPYEHLEPLQLDDDVVEIKTETVEEVYSPLQIFTDQASEIKDLLSEINALSAMHSTKKTNIQVDSLVLPVDIQQDYLESNAENLTDNEKETAEIVTKVDDVQVDEVLVETDSTDEEKVDLIQNFDSQIVDEEVVDAPTEATNVESIQLESVEKESVESAQNNELDTIEAAVENEEIHSDSEFVEQEIIENEKVVELIETENQETESEHNQEEFLLPNETIEPVVENELDSSTVLDGNQVDDPEILVQKPKKKKGFLIALIVIFALTVAFVVNYYLSSATRCWIKYTLLAEDNSGKISNLRTTASDWFTGVKFWFDKEPKIESEEQTMPNEVAKQAVSSVPVAIPDSTADTLEITQNKVVSVQGKLAIDTIKTEPKHIEKLDSLKQLFDGPRVYKTFYGTEKISAGSRLTLISLKYYGQRDFWVYIYEANQALIQDPDRIPLGTVLKIPKLDNRLIDKNNPRCLQKAKELHDLYVSKK